LTALLLLLCRGECSLPANSHLRCRHTGPCAALCCMASEAWAPAG
jgi:hypothetical protein